MVFALRMVLVGAVFLASLGVAAPSLIIEGAYGYTHYHPDDLNEVNRVFEKVSRQVGFKGYDVEIFSGHPEQMLGLGAAFKRLHVTLEAEVWEEKFSQRDVAFTYSSTTGSVDADENYLFLPVCLMFKYPLSWKRLLITPGYGPGIMFGSANVTLSTKYSGDQSHGWADDKMELGFTSGFNVIHRFCVDTYFKILPWVGAGLSAGYRFSEIPYLEVASKKGSSNIFDILFNGGADVGDRLYLGYETLNFIRDEEKKPVHHLVTGNMTGYYLWVKLLFMLGGKS